MIIKTTSHTIYSQLNVKLLWIETRYWYKFYLRAAFPEAAQNSSQWRYYIFRVYRLYQYIAISANGLRLKATFIHINNKMVLLRKTIRLTSKGLVHDFKLYKDTYPDWLSGNPKLLAGSGYQGIAKLHKQTFTPFKKPHGGQLLDLCKQANHYLAKFRIMVKHKIGLIKLLKIVAHKYRNRCQRYDLRMKLLAGVVNFELSL